MFCAVAGGSLVGETVGACFGIITGTGVDKGDFGLTTRVGSAEAPGIALLLSCEGLSIFGLVKGGVVVADGGVGVVCFSGIFVIGLPH